ncbi:unnamed protein product [Lepeophtheirus salmonis]|uniref:(salmon louse) hypothetical protein n=1 Tax=Lepeophtheirus salmonis TaxID=72036 RepID=A0A7R8H5B0_LEPSM|nr:unnamed protein product [Lepeophtheirus salmonis]CAF2864956.1 unnamed protein product [Lepeophtheirus salmonis]
MGSEERLCLRWDDFELNFKNGFSQLRHDEELFDITLATASNQIKAHKVILSSCSPFFPESTFKHLESLMSFMYKGEVHVGQEELDDFLKVAQELKIKGLCASTPDKMDRINAVSPLPKHKKTSTHSSSGKFLSDVDQDIQPTDNEMQSIEDSVNIINHDEGLSSSFECEDNKDFITYQDHESMKDSNFLMIPGVSDARSSLDDNEEYVRALNLEISKFVVDKDMNGNFRCKRCSYVSPRRDTIRAHIEAIHFITSGFKCNICQRTFKTRQSLKTHKLKYHKPGPVLFRKEQFNW